MLDGYQSQGEAAVGKLEDRMERLSPVFRSYVLPWDVRRLVYIMVVRSCMEYAVFIPKPSLTSSGWGVEAANDKLAPIARGVSTANRLVARLYAALPTLRERALDLGMPTPCRL